MTRQLRLVCLEDRMAPAVATWDGGGINNNWTTAGNWIGDAAPQPGDDLVFPAIAARLTNLNDFPASTAFNSLAINGGGYLISGNAIALTAGLSASFAGFESSSLALNLAGMGGVNKSGSGRLILAGDNSFLGVVSVQAGVLQCNTSTALGATGAGNDTIISGPSALDPTIVAFVGAGLTVAENFTLGDSSRIRLESGSATLTGPLTLTGTSTTASVISVGFQATDLLTITGSISESGGSRGLTVDAGSGLVVFASSSVSAYTGTSTVRGTVLFNGQAMTTTIFSSDGIVGGTGRVGPATSGIFDLFGAGLGGFQPSTAGTVGTLTTGNFNLNNGGTLGIDLTPTGADQVDVHGTVQLNGFLNIHSTPDFKPTIGAHIRLIDNDGSDAVTGAFLKLTEGAVVRTIDHVALRLTYHGGDGNDVELFADKEAPALAVGADSGSLPFVNVYGGNGALLTAFPAYDSNFRGGVRVATADITGDGIEDIITAPGAGGGPHIRIFDGVSFAVVREFLAYHPTFVGGVFVSAGDVNNDGRPDIITGAGAGGGPHVQAFSGTDNFLLSNFMAYELSFTGGVSVGHYGSTIVTGPGFGGGPVVRSFAANGVMLQQFLAFDASFRGGVFVASVSGTAGQTVESLIVSAGPSGGPHVKVYQSVFRAGLVLFTEFFAYDARFTGGVLIAGADLNGDQIGELITGAGPSGGPHVEAWALPSTRDTPVTLAAGFYAFDPSFIGGVFVG